MWYIFPQVGGLGVSTMSQRYAIGSVAEAQALLAHPVLGDRYRRIVDAVWHQIVEDGATVNALFGSPDDAKLVSSLTLFAQAARRLESPETASTTFVAQAEEILLAAYAQGFDRCRTTERFAASPYDAQVRPIIREAIPSDDAVMDAIAREGNASADADYLELVRSQNGRLLVAELAGQVVAYGGVVDIDGVAMLCDLFVAADQRGAGIGSLLLQELFDGTHQRMTFSSKHPAALAAYRRTGMEPQWRLLYLKGVAVGGGPEIRPAAWRHDRVSLVEQMARQGGHVSADVVLWPEKKNGTWIARLKSARPVEDLAAALAGLTRDTIVTMCTPEHSPIAAWASHNGFAVVDYDTFCATPGVYLPDDLHCLDPGLV